jgi:hypothetical protein
MKDEAKKQKRKRGTVSFEPMGPVATMLGLALRGKPRGYKTRVIEDAIAEKYREKYPKHYQAYSVLRTEAA